MSPLQLADFADKMNEIMPILLKEFARRQTKEVYKGKITLPQILILQFLSEEKSIKMTDIARFMKVSTAATTGIIDRLVKAGYLARIFEPSDRRIINIRITPKGDELIKKINQERRKFILNIFAKISEKDRKDYLRILLQIRDILDKEG